MARRSACTAAANIDEAIRPGQRLARTDCRAGIFTQDIDAALAFARRVDSGNLHINWGPAWRADLMPYGGLKESGLGKEGPQVCRAGNDRAEDGRDSRTLIIRLIAALHRGVGQAATAYVPAEALIRNRELGHYPVRAKSERIAIRAG